MTKSDYPSFFRDCIVTNEEAMKATVTSGARIASGFATSEPHTFYKTLWKHIQSEDIRELVRDMCVETADPARVRGRPIPLEPPLAEQLDRLTMPVLAVNGELDVADVFAAADYLAANAPEARAVVIPDVAHFPGLEAPEELGALITDLLAPLPRWR